MVTSSLDAFLSGQEASCPGARASPTGQTRVKLFGKQIETPGMPNSRIMMWFSASISSFQIPFQTFADSRGNPGRFVTTSKVRSCRKKLSQSAVQTESESAKCNVKMERKQKAVRIQYSKYSTTAAGTCKHYPTVSLPVALSHATISSASAYN